MRVSEALAILVYRLVFDRATRAKELSARARGATSTPFPASLSLGQRVTSDSAAGKWLSTLITRKGSASRAAG